MWYFAWILGLGLAATVGILNALWYELRVLREQPEDVTSSLPTP
jgi:cyd operon protein YbgT